MTERQAAPNIDPNTNTNKGEAPTGFLKIFHKLAPYKHRYEVFRDFVTMTAISLHNAVHKDENLEAEYLQIIGGYKPNDRQDFPKLLSCLIDGLEDEPRDVLGKFYMDLEIANKNTGQFFTPAEVSNVMAEITFGDALDKLQSQPFITASEPACGAGGMIMALVKMLVNKGYNPAAHLWVQCIDIDRMAALMCYTQLTLWNVPAEVIVGDALRWETREVWHTPAHHLGLWKHRLRRDEQSCEVTSTTQPPAPIVLPRQAPPSTIKPTQLGFDF